MHVPYLKELGADITVKNQTATIVGPTKLKGSSVVATDLRAGAAMVAAGLLAEGKTTITNVEHILRGYENIIDTSLGDGVSLGINSYAIDDYSYADYYRDFKLKEKEKVKLIDSYSKKEMSITSLAEKIKTDNKLKEDLNSSNILFLTIGYNDLLYKIELEENLTNSRLLSITREIDKSYNKW